MKSKQVLIDSSVWIEYFRKGEGKIFDIIDVLLDSNRAAFCVLVFINKIPKIKITQSLNHQITKCINKTSHYNSAL